MSHDSASVLGSSSTENVSAVMSETYEMTAEGLATLRTEVEELETTGRARIAAEIKTAREFGDLKENAEYHAAKDAQGMLEARIAQLRERLNHAKIVETTGGTMVTFGSHVAVVDEDSGKEATYELVAAQEAAPSAGRLSVESPVAVALRGKRAGDVAAVHTPRGTRRLRVVSVS
jgi:transcription elongation factor GreA